MADLVYQTIIDDLKKSINAGAFPELKLPDERSLTEQYQVSRSSVKRALNELANEGIIFKKRGSGTFINPIYLKSGSFFNYSGSNLGVTDSFKAGNRKLGIKLLDFQVVKPSAELQQNLFLQPDEFVYQIKRLRLLDAEPFMSETSFIPIRVAPELNEKIVAGSIFNYLESERNQEVTKSFLTIYAEPSTALDQSQLQLKATEPVGIMAGIFFLDDGTPFEFSTMRLHYRYMKYNTFVSVSGRE